MKTIFFILLNICCYTSVVALTNIDLDLLQAYHLAEHNDPQLQITRAQWHASKYQTRASLAAFLPAVDLAANWGRMGVVHVFPDSKIRGYTFTINQAVFNLGNWYTLVQNKQSSLGLKDTYQAAQQALILRVTTAYFNILSAMDIVKFDRVALAAINKQLRQAKDRYRAGTNTNSDVEVARASYAATQAQFIADRNAVKIQREQLRQIISIDFGNLHQLTHNFSLAIIDPKWYQLWLDKAMELNYSYRAQKFTTLASDTGVKLVWQQYLPQVDLAVIYAGLISPYTSNVFTRSWSILLSVTFPIFTSGNISHSLAQARDKYASAKAAETAAARQLRNSVTTTLRNIASAKAEIQALRTAVVSARTSMQFTIDSYQAGTRTMVDVMNSISAWQQTQSKLAQNNYNFINAKLQLLSLTSELGEPDVAAVNALLAGN